MKIRIFLTLVVLLVTAGTMSMALGQEHPKKAEHPAKSEHPAKAEHPAKPGDIVAVAAGAGDFETLVAAIKAAGLVETLQGEGPFTVFAPTDEAFAKLPADTLKELLKPENKKKLAGILKYHVVPGKIMAADVKTMKATSANGQDLNIKVADGKVTVNDATVVATDVAASNGVIHVVDTVIIPPKK